MEQETPEGLTAPRRKTAVVDGTTSSVTPGRAPVISRIPPLKTSSVAPHLATARPRPVGSQPRELPQDTRRELPPAEQPDMAYPRRMGESRLDARAAAALDDPRMGFVVDTQWDENPESTPAAPPAWLAQLTRWQWNSTLLAVSVVLVSGLVMAMWQQRELAAPPAQLAAPTIHYHLESPQLPVAETMQPTSHARGGALTEATHERPVDEQSDGVALTARNEPARSGPDTAHATIQPGKPPREQLQEDASTESAHELLDYPETNYPDYTAPLKQNRAVVRLDGRIQEYK